MPKSNALKQPAAGTAPSSLYLNNTLTRRKDRFRSRQPGTAKLVTCGPSVYRYPHVGNFRTFLYEDILHRYLKYLGYDVQRLINFTDVEDKAIAEMRKTGRSRKQITQPVEKRFFREAGTLCIELPEEIARSSTSVPQAVKLIEELVEKGFAYWHGKDVFFDPLKFKGFGKLFGLDMSRWPEKKIRFRRDTYNGNRWNRGDFILWHGCNHERDEGVCWDTEIGRGRPSWNIQDPAMISQHMGYEVDISCGGVDNLYRHHDYNIAVLEALSGKTFSPYWLHGEHVLVDGAKMSKSKGNTVYLEDLLKKGYQPRHVRFFLIMKHYRKRLNLTHSHLEKTRKRLDEFNRLVRVVTQPGDAGIEARKAGQPSDPEADLYTAFEKGMNDDLDVAGAFEALERRMKGLAVLKDRGELTASDMRRTRDALAHMDQVLQVMVI